ncbi:corrinoid protein [Acetobacterium bakii]|uniref:Methyltransferase n=1 Tax=Acetobacterium bakii TaxID=52689 RepID=A0A0L6U5K4_9FIRM|nr:corrinoid protein [Acetobacterium bakii]KNZ43612.1 methyltransferase [Acetobacterium bakii]
MSLLNEISEAVIAGNVEGTREKVKLAVQQEVNASSILNDGLMVGINEIGVRFGAGKIFVPTVLMAAKAMHEGVEVIKPLLESDGPTTVGKAIVGTVKGDLHDIGKKLVVLMMRSVNIDVIDMGSNVTAEQFIEGIKEHNPQIVGLSALLTTTMNEQAHIIKAFEEAGVRDQVKVLIGGAPVTQGWANKINADGFAADAASAANWAKEYVTSL